MLEGRPFPNLLSEFVYTRTYARWLEDAKRRETWPETVIRYTDYIFKDKKVPEGLSDQAQKYILGLDIMPSMRALWCAGPTMDRDNVCAYNCSFLPVDNLRAFGEALYILMNGTGVGFSVERTFVNCLPTVLPPDNTSIDYGIQDSTEGWADAVYFAMVQGHLGRKVNWNYSLIRPKGARLKTKGGRASGPMPLRRVLNFIRDTLREAEGRRLKTIEAHDIMCMEAEIVMVGGFRRASLISLSDVDDPDMRSAKDFSKGQFPTIRYMANNSAVYNERPTREVFDREWNALVKSGSGERGFYIVSPNQVAKRGGEYRPNPCVSAHSWVHTTEGPRQVLDLIGKPFDAVVDGKSYKSSGQGFWKTGTRPLFRLTTDDGYSLDLTGNHQVCRVRQTRGTQHVEWVPASELVPGDLLRVNNHREVGCEPSSRSDLGWLLGSLIGDGTLAQAEGNRSDSGLLRFWGPDGEFMAKSAMSRIGSVGLKIRSDAGPVDCHRFWQVSSTSLGDVAHSYGLVPAAKTITPAMERETEGFTAGLLSGLFDADGSVQGNQEKGVSVRLSQSNIETLQAAQRMLLRLGIVSTIYPNRRDAGYREFSDGQGGKKEYFCQAQHELVVANDNLFRFEEVVGFTEPSKKALLGDLMGGYKRAPNRERFVATFRALTPIGEADVFDCTVPDLGAFDANGLYVHNCGEIKLRFRRATDPWTGAGGGGQFCNLAAAVMRSGDTVVTMADKVRVATWLGVIQSSYTFFPYLRPAWKELSDEDRLVGVDITGQCDNPALSGDEAAMSYLNQVARETADLAADTMGINRPKAVTCGKPSGNCRPWYALTTTDAGLLTLQDLFEHHPNGQEWAPLQQDIHVVRPEGDARKITRTYDNGDSSLIRLNLLYGLSVEATPNHKWFVKYRVGPGRKITDVQDWVPAKDIRPGDVLEVKLGTYTKGDHAKLSTFNSRAWHMAISAKPISTPGALNEDVCWFLGYLWGDGAMSPGGYRLRFTDENVWNLTKVQRVLMEQFGLESTLSNPKGRKDYTLEFASVHLWHWLLENEVFKYNASGGVDIIPRVVRSSSRDDIIAFMAGLLDSDGWAGYKRQGLGSFTFTTANPLLARHLQDVAWSVGLGVGRSLNSLGTSFQKKREMYLLGCSSQVDPGAFDALLRNSNKVRRVAEGERFKDWEWRQAKREYHVGRVVSVEETLPVPTFDIEVDVDHWYYAGAIKSHNSSQFVDCASGFHTRYAKFYFRHVRISSKDPLFRLIRDQGVPLFAENGQEHLPEEDVDVWVARFPVKSPAGAMLRDHERAIDQCRRYLKVMRSWCGQRGHNQSATIYVRENEWAEVGEWLWENFDDVTGLSFLPYDESGTMYRLPPYVEISEAEYHEAMQRMPLVDFSVLPYYETQDEGEGAQEPACMGGACTL